MGKRAKLIVLGVSEERLAEADYYARRCGIPRDEALRILESAYTKAKPEERKLKKRSED